MLTRYVLICIMLLALSGCAFFDGKPDNASSMKVSWQAYAEGCQTKSAVSKKTCSSFQVDSIQFNKIPVLNQLIEKELLTLLGGKQFKNLLAFQEAFLARTTLNEHVVVTVVKLEETEKLILLELNVQRNALAQGYLPQQSSFLTFNKETMKEVHLLDVVKGEQLPVFNKIVKQAYTQWLEVNQLLNDEVFQADWPFVETQNMALRKKVLVLKYQPNTLAPYAFGFPVLRIPYSELEGVIHSRYIFKE